MAEKIKSEILKTKNSEPLLSGSVWRKWDLHIHTPSSYDWDKGCKDSAEDIVKKAISENISVIAITDHHTVKGIDGVVKTAKGKDITILPGVELRTDKGNKGIHIIGVFDSSTTSKILYDKLLCPLNLSENDIKTKGDKEIYCNFENACQKIHELGGLVLLHAGNKSSGIEQLDSDIQATLKKDLAFLVDIFEVSAQKQVEDYRNIVFPKIKQEFPCIITSDACDRSKLQYKKGHSTEVIGKNYSWIKADPTFEGLKQIIYEPEERVFIGQENPNRFSYPIVSKVKINNCSKSFFFEKNLEINFNPHLVTIIGSRGSGKSAFLDTLVLPLDKQEVLNRDNYIKDGLNKKGVLDVLLNVQSSSDGNEKSLVFKNFSYSETVKEFPFEYYSQKEIGHLADPKSKTDLSKLIFQKIFERRAEEEIKLIRKYTDDALSKLGENREQVQKIERDLKDEKALKEKLEGNKKQIGFLQDPQIKCLVEKREKFIQIQTQYKEIKEKINDEVKTIKKSIEILQPTRFDYISIKTKENESFLPKEWIQFEKSHLLQLIKNILDGKEKLFDSLTTILNKIEEHDKYFDQKEIKNINGEIRKVVKEKNLSYSDKGVEDLQKKIATAEAQLKKIEELRKKKQELIKERGEIRKAYFSNLGTIKSKLENVFAAFCNEEGEILNERVKIAFSLSIKKEECIDIIEKDHTLDSSFCGNFPREILLRIIGERGTDKVIDALRKGNFNSWQEWENIGPRTVEYLNNIINKEEIAMSLEEILPTLSFGLKWRVAQNYKPLTECSIGERSTAVLSIILVSGTIPLIIDQPEDDLDHSYIFKPLTDIIKHVKKKRQLIFTTHNANIVINGDAEQILIMETKDGKRGNITISTIEDIERRNKLLSILEGGKEAFKNREKRYDFK